jgi:acyl-CoA thioester hydrolase
MPVRKGKSVSVIYHEPFRVRYYECDAYSHLSRLSYLRWMQEAAFGASKEVGYDFAHYMETGHLWLVRETDIQFITPIDYGAEIIVKTWVVDFRRSHSLRRYEFIHGASEEVVARASTDWVYVNMQTLRPVTVPEAMQSAFSPNGGDETEPPRGRIARNTSEPPSFSSVRIRIAWRDIDSMWHVNNPAYLKYIEDADARTQEARGWPRQRMVEAGREAVVRDYSIEYRQPAQVGEEIEIASWSSDVKECGALSHYTIRRVKDGAVLARASMSWEWVDVKSGRTMVVPADFLGDCCLLK